MERVIIFFLALLCYTSAHSQLKPINKKELKTLIREGIAKDKNYCWEICSESLTEKMDTLLIQPPNSYDCSNFSRWNFKQSNTIIQVTIKRETHITSSGWREYTFESSPFSNNNFYKIKLRTLHNKLILSRYNKSRLIDSYEVLGYSETKNQISNITLVKQ
ncbi:MAG: hypothetical protein DI539_07535 [Flavobacterium psychrophilum]|nr:MAG: hypothetical protein DI539_07535 [Flavobacterium psychrophilum]